MALNRLLFNILSIFAVYFCVIESINAWENARATFYGDIHGGETISGACGYGNTVEQGYGIQTAAISPALFNNGATCGACFEIMCVNSPLCHRGIIHITATNLCPANYTKTTDIWCNPPQKHFDLTMPMFLQIAQYQAGVVPVVYRRIKCGKIGGIKFQISGNQKWLLVLVFNVGGAGDVVSVRVKGSSSNWIQMNRNWGQNWQTFTSLQGQSLSFEVQTSDRQIVQSIDVAPRDWHFGMTYQGNSNFH